VAVLASLSLALATIPILACLALLALSVFIVGRRGSLVAQARRTAEAQHAGVVRADQTIEQQLVEGLRAGKSLKDATDAFLQQRESLVPGATPDRPGHWSSDDLKAYFQNQLAEAISAINRRLLMLAVIAGSSVIAVSVTAMTVLYGLHTPRAAEQGLAPQVQAVPASQSIPDAMPTAEFPPLMPEALVPIAPPARQGNDSASAAKPLPIPVQAPQDQVPSVNQM